MVLWWCVAVLYVQRMKEPNQGAILVGRCDSEQGSKSPAQQARLPLSIDMCRRLGSC